jgi:predicted nucleic acid-binding protein
MIVADASALVKLVVEEEHSALARQIILKETSVGEPIEVPDLAISEVLNTLWVYYTKKKRITEAAYDTAVANFDKIIKNLDIIPATSLKDVALRVAVLKGRSVYDSMYIASSLLKGAPLLTFDVPMRNTASGLGVTVISNE